MKQIASLLMASICLLALVSPSFGTESRWGWSALEQQKTLEAPAPLVVSKFAKLAAPAAGELTVVSVNLDPKTTRVPGVLAGVWPKLKEALDAVRKAVSKNPSLRRRSKPAALKPPTLLVLASARTASWRCW